MRDDMELKWEDPPEVASEYQLRAREWWDETAQLLKSHPGEWAIIPRSHYLARIQLSERGDGFEVTSRDQASRTKRRTYARFNHPAEEEGA